MRPSRPTSVLVSSPWCATGWFRPGRRGPEDVQVDLPSGKVTVTSEQPLDRAVVAAAVDEAGYELVGGEAQ
ncbi:hypothetical protein [Streptomyces djakartensis]|uniref:Copper chaperone n=1 Tax=Streptomyces djakartensis TaxID=68193 RepID=A0ABQ3A7C7_9ACTN|nr:hypothetical protein [Streptomyces djakartensis]GGY35696.1 hypothetical protein GCM10010384_48690 [Streptomyces djakartensis]